MKHPRHRRPFPWKYLFLLVLAGGASVLWGGVVPASPPSPSVDALDATEATEATEAEEAEEEVATPDDDADSMTDSDGSAAAALPADRRDAASLPSAWGRAQVDGSPLSLDRWVVGIGIGLALAGLVTWSARKAVRRRAIESGVAPSMELLGRLPLGGRRGLVMVRAADRLLVLGMSDAGLQPLLERPFETFDATLDATIKSAADDECESEDNA